MKKKTSLFTLLLIILFIFLTLPAFIYLLNPGFPNTQDGEYYLIRTAAFHRCLRDFQIPPRFAGYLNHTYGYPILNFLYPLFYYLSEGLYLLGVPLVLSVKTWVILSFIFSAYFMYLFCREFFSAVPSALAACFYVYTPYRFTDVYLRGSFGEALAFVFIPLVFWSIVRLLKFRQKKYLQISSLSFAALLISHNVMAFIFSPLILLFMFLNLYQKRKSKKSPPLLKPIIMMVLLALGLSCFFWLPAISEIKFTVFSQTRVSTFFDYFPQVSHLFFPFKKNLPFAPGFEDKTALQIGPLHTLIILLSLTFLLKKRKKMTPLFFLLSVLISLFLMNPISSSFWRIKSLHQLVQFPWRLLSVVCFSTAFLSAFILSPFKNKKVQFFLFLFLSLLLILTNKKNFMPKNYLFRNDDFYFTNDSTTVTQNEYLPRWIKNPPREAPAQKIEAETNYQITRQKSNLLEFTISAPTPQPITINTIYYPGWSLYINNQKTPINFQKSGLIEFEIPKGESRVKLLFSETPLRAFSDIITLGSLFYLVLITFSKSQKL